MNRIYLNLTIAWRSLSSFRLRSFLAVLGVFLGTFSLILVSNLSGSLAEKTRLEISNLGENLLIVKSGTVRSFGSRTRLLSQATTLTPEDAVAILDGSKYVKNISPSSSKTFPVRYKNTILPSTLVVGAVANFPEIRNFNPQQGTFLSEQDDDQLAKVVVIGKKVADKLFGDEDPIGRYLLIRRAPCQVIGIMEEKGADISGADQDDQIFLPLSTFLRRFVNQDYIDTIYVQTIDEHSLPLAKVEIESILRERHKITEGKKDDFTVIDLKDVMALKTQATRMITLLGRISAVISFLIGGIGILSIMILIVNERRVEIGIRRAIGARKRDIVLQFLTESSFISLVGGTVGVLIGLLASVVIFEVSDLPFSASLAGLLFSFVASVMVGILAGIYPSRKAISIQPVDIIRS